MGKSEWRWKRVKLRLKGKVFKTPLPVFSRRRRTSEKWPMQDGFISSHGGEIQSERRAYGQEKNGISSTGIHLHEVPSDHQLVTKDESHLTEKRTSIDSRPPIQNTTRYIRSSEEEDYEFDKLKNRGDWKKKAEEKLENGQEVKEIKETEDYLTQNTGTNLGSPQSLCGTSVNGASMVPQNEENLLHTKKINSQENINVMGKINNATSGSKYQREKKMEGKEQKHLVRQVDLPESQASLESSSNKSSGSSMLKEKSVSLAKSDSEDYEETKGCSIINTETNSSSPQSINGKSSNGASTVPQDEENLQYGKKIDPQESTIPFDMNNNATSGSKYQRKKKKKRKGQKHLVRQNDHPESQISLESTSNKSTRSSTSKERSMALPKPDSENYEEEKGCLILKTETNSSSTQSLNETPSNGSLMLPQDEENIQCMKKIDPQEGTIPIGMIDNDTSGSKHQREKKKKRKGQKHLSRKGDLPESQISFESKSNKSSWSSMSKEKSMSLPKSDSEDYKDTKGRLIINTEKYSSRPQTLNGTHSNEASAVPQDKENLQCTNKIDSQEITIPMGKIKNGTPSSNSQKKKRKGGKGGSQAVKNRNLSQSQPNLESPSMKLMKGLMSKENLSKPDSDNYVETKGCLKLNAEINSSRPKSLHETSLNGASTEPQNEENIQCKKKIGSQEITIPMDKIKNGTPGSNSQKRKGGKGGSQAVKNRNLSKSQPNLESPSMKLMNRLMSKENLPKSDSDNYGETKGCLKVNAETNSSRPKSLNETSSNGASMEPSDEENLSCAKKINPQEGTVPFGKINNATSGSKYQRKKKKGGKRGNHLIKQGALSKSQPNLEAMSIGNSTGTMSKEKSLSMPELGRNTELQTLLENLKKKLVARKNIEEQTPGTRRPIVLDGANLAYSHGRNRYFSSDGLLLGLKYFLDLGHQDITIFLVRRFKIPARDREVTQALQLSGFLTWVERKVVLKADSKTDNKADKKTVVQQQQPSDDIHLLEYANDRLGIVISNDMFRDVQRDFPDLREQVRERCSTFTFVQDKFMIPRDPLGKNGPKRGAFLRF